MKESNNLNLLMKLIKTQPLFLQLTDNEAEELADLFTEMKIPPGTLIVKEGELVDSIYLIASGTAMVESTTRDYTREDIYVGILSSGDPIGLNEIGFYLISGKRIATVTAMTEMVLFRLNMAAFHGFALSHTHVSEILHKEEESHLDKKS